MQGFHPTDTVRNDAIGTRGHTPNLDGAIITAIAQAPVGRNWDEESPAAVLEALRDAGFDVVPGGIGKLGHAVTRATTAHPPAPYALTDQAQQVWRMGWTACLDYLIDGGVS